MADPLVRFFWLHLLGRLLLAAEVTTFWDATAEAYD
jgi:hypothetical protein